MIPVAHRLRSLAVLMGSAALIAILVSSNALNAVHARTRSAALTGPILHIIRITPSAWIQDEQGNTIVQPGDTYESWTDVPDGLSKVVQTDGQGKVVMVSYEVRQPDGTFALTTVGAGPTSTHHLQAPLVNGQIENGFWFGGESSLAGMRAEYAGYLRQAGSGVMQDILNGIPMKRFDATSTDGLVGTIWLNQAGLPVQVEANHDPHQITKFPVIEELSASRLSRGMLASATLRGLIKQSSPQSHRLQRRR